MYPSISGSVHTMLHMIDQSSHSVYKNNEFPLTVTSVTCCLCLPLPKLSRLLHVFYLECFVYVYKLLLYKWIKWLCYVWIVMIRIRNIPFQMAVSIVKRGKNLYQDLSTFVPVDPEFLAFDWLLTAGQVSITSYTPPKT